MSARHRRKRRRSAGVDIATYLKGVRENMVAALKHKFGAAFTPELEQRFRRDIET